MKTNNTTLFKGLLIIFLAVGFIWARSSYGKISGGEFVSSLGKTLTKNVQTNPYSFYADFLQVVAIPNSEIFAQMTMWGEFLTAVSIIGGALYLLLKNPKEKLAFYVLIAGLVGGFFLNINFWFAFSWTSPSAGSLNLLMMLIQFIGAVTLIHFLKKEKL